MEALISFFGAALALFAIFALYIFGTAVVLRFFERLSLAKDTPLHDGSAPHSVP